MIKYEVNFYDNTNGATSAIDVIEVNEGYTTDEYISDCESNGNPLHDVEGGNDFNISFMEVEQYVNI